MILRTLCLQDLIVKCGILSTQSPFSFVLYPGSRPLLMRTVFLSVIVVLYCSFGALAQNSLIFKQIDTTTGLPGTNTSLVQEGSDGRMWISLPEAGLARFDGFSFEHYTKGNSNGSILSDWVTALYPGSNGCMWIGTYESLSRWCPDSVAHTMHNVSRRRELQPLRAILEDSTGVWAGYHGLMQFEVGDSISLTARYEAHGKKGDLSSNLIVKLFRDNNLDLWIVCDNGLNRMNRDMSTFQQFLMPDGLAITSATRSDNLVVLGSDEGGVWTFDIDQGTYMNISESLEISGVVEPGLKNVNAIVAGNSSIWAGTESGLLEWCVGSRVARVHRHVEGDPKSLLSNNITSLSFDRSEKLWVSTISGLSILDPLQNTVKRHTHDPDQNSIAGNVVAPGIVDQDGSIWIGIKEKGLDRILPSGHVRHYEHDLDNPNSLSNNDVVSLYEDNQGWIWVAHWYGGITKFDPRTDTFIRFRSGQPGSEFLSDDTVYDVFQDRDGSFWLGTNKGVDRYDPKSGRYQHFAIGQSYRIIQRRTGMVFVASASGLFRIDKALVAEKLVNGYMINVAEGVDGNLYTLEPGLGVLRYDADHPKLEQLSDIDDRLAGPFFRLMIGSDGRIWLGGKAGIHSLNPQSNEVTTYVSIEDDPGIHSVPLFENDGRIYFGGYSGLLYFNPDSIAREREVRKPIVTRFAQIGDPTSRYSTGSEQVSLAHNQNDFELEFVSIDIMDPERLEFSYRLDGYHDNWIPAGTKRIATYTNLDHGHYAFTVKARDKYTDLEAVSNPLTFRISRAWYETWWSYLLYMLVIVTTIYLVVRSIVRQQRLKSQMQFNQMEVERLAELDQMKTQFYTNITHEFRTPLTLLMGPLNDLKGGTLKGDQRTIYDIMHRNAQRLLLLINQLLDLGQVRSGVTLNVSVQDVVEFLKSSFGMFESYASVKKIGFQFQSNVSTLPAYFDYDKLDKIVANLLSNAFKFCNEGDHVTLKLNGKVDDSEIDHGDGVLEISVIDSGPGIPQELQERIFDQFFQGDSNRREVEGSGVGLSLVKAFATLHGGRVTVDSKVGQGARFNLRFPLGKAHLAQAEIATETTMVAPNEPLVSPIRPLRKLSDTLGPTILIVDDNQDMLLYLEQILQDDFHVIAAHDGQEGFNRAVETIPEIVISDVMMPVLDGFQLLQQLKSDERTSHIPVVLLTARVAEEAKTEGLSYGADDYITKPFSPVELRARVQNLFELLKAVRLKYSKNIFLDVDEVHVNPVDTEFIERAREVMRIYVSDSEFTSEKFSMEMGMSRSQMHRKMKGLTGYSAGEFIRGYRLEFAEHLLTSGSGNVSQVAYECGFSSPSHFTKLYKEKFGVLPSQASGSA